MIAIVISACLVGDPHVCRDYRIPLAIEVDANRCLARAQPHFAAWAAQHPGWTITRWRCTTGDVEDL